MTGQFYERNRLGEESELKKKAFLSGQRGKKLMPLVF